MVPEQRADVYTYLFRVSHPRNLNVYVLPDLLIYVSYLESKWKKYRPYWCTDSGRMLIKRGTSARQCQSYCGYDCVAVEWWKRGKNACYLCRNLTLLTRFPHKSDKSFPPIVFVKKSNGKSNFTSSTSYARWLLLSRVKVFLLCLGARLCHEILSFI